MKIIIETKADNSPSLVFNDANGNLLFWEDLSIQEKSKAVLALSTESELFKLKYITNT